MKINKKLKRLLNPYNLAIAGCIIIIIVSLIIIFVPNNKKIEVDGVPVVQSSIKETEEITEEEARKLAVKQFKKLDEKIKAEELNVKKIQRKGEEYYYITSVQNTLEIKIKGGEITRINSSVVEK